MKELASLRKKVEQGGAGDAELSMLAGLITTLKDLVTQLKERAHDALLSEVLGIKLWCTHTVRA